MSETDDIFDLDDFLVQEEIPDNITKAWKRHLKYFNQCEKAAEDASKIIKALNVIKEYFKR